MLRYNSVIECYHYNIDLIDPIDRVCNLAFNIALIIDPAFEVEILFNKEFVGDVIGLDFDNVKLLEEEEDGSFLKNENDINKLRILSTAIADFINNDVLGLTELHQTKILFIHKKSKTLFALNKSKQNLKSEAINELEKKKNIANSIITIIKEQQYIKRIIDAIDNEVVKKCLKDSISFDHDEFYSDYVQITDLKVLEVPYLKMEFLKEEFVEIEAYEEDHLWINKDKLNLNLKIEIGDDKNISTVKLKDGELELELGILYNDYIFPISDRKLDRFILDGYKSEYHWIQIKEVFKVNEINKPYLSDPIISDFKKNFKKKKFTNLLSFLKLNLYLENSLLDQNPNFKHFFIDVLKIDDVKYLEKFNFFISNVDPEISASLGIYSFEKMGENASAFNLLHWFRKLGENSLQFRDHNNPSNSKKKIKNYKALVPEIAFYFITRFFEDLLQDLFTELKLDFISNFYLFSDKVDLGEFDFLIKNDNKFYFIEAKTTLSKENIKKYKAKCELVLKAFEGINIDIEFLMIGSYSNPNCEDLRFFINQSHKGNKRYNKLTSIPEIGTTPYLFYFPIDNGNKKLTCISEPDYHNLKKLIKKYV